MAGSLLQKLQNKHFLSLAGNGLMSLLGMASMAIIYRAFPNADEIGGWVFFQSVFLLVDTFRSGFLTTAFIKFYAGASEDRSASIAGSAWFIGGCITGILFLLTLPFMFFLPHIKDEGLQLFFKWAGISYICTLPYFIATCIQQAEQRFDRLLYIRFINQALFIITILVLWHLQLMSVQRVVYAYLLAASFTSLISIIAGWARVKTFFKRSKEATSDLFHFGKFSVGTTLSSNMFRNSDTFIINFMLGPAALATYNLGLRLMELVEIPLRSLAATAMPSLSSAYNRNNKEEVIYITKKYTGILTTLLIPAAIITVLLADIAMSFIGGGKYAGTLQGIQAANVFRLFMTFALLYPADRFLALSIDVINQPRINFIKVLVMLVVNIGGDFAGVALTHNVYGIAISSVFPTLIGVLVGYWALNRYSNFPFFSIYSLGYRETKQFVMEKLKQRKLVK